ncbi:hypothetical protein AB0M10_11355 [Streptomyces sp. NPDC051840]|uniref:hypothetical protein n=1 Tax=unclassified Streptomyces TaxID=2593676 RepID=UPI003443FBEC
MRLPPDAMDTTALVEVVRITALRPGGGASYPGEVVAHWAGNEITEAFAAVTALPGGGQHRCGFSPGWGMRAYESSLELLLFEAAFCFRCHEVRMHGPAVPPALATQFFDADAPQARALLELLRSSAARG